MRINALLVFVLVVITVACKSTDEQQKDFFRKANTILNKDFTGTNLSGIIVTDEYGDTILLDSLLMDTSYLFMVYSEINCLTCVETVLKFVKEKDSELLKRLIIISKYRNPRNLYVFKRLNNFEGMVYNVSSGDIIEKFESTLPLFFINEKAKTKNLFWADKKRLDMLDSYLGLISEELNIRK